VRVSYQSVVSKAEFIAEFIGAAAGRCWNKEVEAIGIFFVCGVSIDRFWDVRACMCRACNIWLSCVTVICILASLGCIAAWGIKVPVIGSTIIGS